MAYGSLLQERQRALHGRIVEAIETLYSDRLIEQVERLAHHAARGEVWEKAVTYLRQAGVKADGPLGRLEKQSSYFEQALNAMAASARESRDPRTGHRSATADLRTSAGGRSGEQRDGFVEHFSEAEALGKALGDKRRLARV